MQECLKNGEFRQKHPVRANGRYLLTPGDSRSRGLYRIANQNLKTISADNVFADALKELASSRI